MITEAEFTKRTEELKLQLCSMALEMAAAQQRGGGDAEAAKFFRRQQAIMTEWADLLGQAADAAEAEATKEALP